MKLWGITHQGVVREQNQDAFTCQILPGGEAILLVCDGMGGARAGNIASSMAVEVFMEEFLRQKEETQPRERMERAAAVANGTVFQRSHDDTNCAGMGTTIVAAMVWGDQALILNEGDSRAYCVTRESISRLTRDHSLVEDLVQRGELTEEQARTHPHKNLITRALGAEPNLRADFFELTIHVGQFLLLCTDGLSNVVTEQEILYEVIHGGPAEECCSRLLEIALNRGAPDNVTVVLLQYEMER